MKNEEIQQSIKKAIKESKEFIEMYGYGIYSEEEMPEDALFTDLIEMLNQISSLTNYIKPEANPQSSTLPEVNND